MILKYFCISLTNINLSYTIHSWPFKTIIFYYHSSSWLSSSVIKMSWRPRTCWCLYVRPFSASSSSDHSSSPNCSRPSLPSKPWSKPASSLHPFLSFTISVHLGVNVTRARKFVEVKTYFKLHVSEIAGLFNQLKLTFVIAVCMPLAGFPVPRKSGECSKHKWMWI